VTQLGFEIRNLRLRKRRSPQRVELVLDHPGSFAATLNLSLCRLGGIVVPLEVVSPLRVVWRIEQHS